MRGLRYLLSGLLAASSLMPFVFMLLISFEHHRVITGNPLHWIPTEPTLTTYTDVLSLSGCSADKYDEAYSALLGAEMHRKSFENSAWGPWETAVAGIFFPSPFDGEHDTSLAG